MKPLTAVDFFSGAGGLTEGFAQQGVEVEAALDIWKLALDTHLLNHPSTEVMRRDILEVEPTEVPQADILDRESTVH